MQHFKLYEEWNFAKKEHNIYALMGQNMQNFMNSKQQEFIRNRHFEQKFLKDLQFQIDKSRANILNNQDVLKLITDFAKDILSKVEKTDINDLKIIHKLYFSYMSFLILAFRFDTVKFFKYLNKEKWFNFYKIDSIKNLEDQNKLIVQNWNKISDDVNKTKSLLVSEINADVKHWQHAFRDIKVLKFRDLTTYTIKPDEQQVEAENHIIEFNSKIDNTTLEQIEKTNANAAEKVKRLTEITGFTEEFLKRFDQRGLPDSHKMMKRWFLEAFQKAEKEFGQTLVVTSGIRTEEYQKYLATKGYKTAKKHSPHIQGVAADISIVNLDVDKLIAAFQKAGFTRFGVGKTFIHLDLGDKLNPKIWVPYARWTYTY